MKSIHLLIVLIIYSSIASGQKANPFRIERIHVKTKSERKSTKDFKRESTYFYEDSDYYATKTCHGEFGGILFMTEKRSGKEYLCRATCSVIINKLNGKYFLTTTLAHMNGRSVLFEIDNPKDLMEVDVDSAGNKIKREIIGVRDTPELNFRQGTKIIVDTFDVLTLASFPYNDKLYHIITDFKKTYLAEISGHKFKNIELLSEKSIWTYYPEVIKTIDNHYVLFFDNDEAAGYVDIFANSIKLYLYE
jgi:hypothetical protein